MSVLSWFENYTEQEIPAENLWDDAEAIELHFKMIRARREAEMRGERALDEDDDGASMGNELADSFKS